jgi:hypothetical protein
MSLKAPNAVPAKIRIALPKLLNSLAEILLAQAMGSEWL